MSKQDSREIGSLAQGPASVKVPRQGTQKHTALHGLPARASCPPVIAGPSAF